MGRVKGGCLQPAQRTFDAGRFATIKGWGWKFYPPPRACPAARALLPQFFAKFSGFGLVVVLQHSGVLMSRHGRQFENIEIFGQPRRALMPKVMKAQIFDS